MATPSSTPRSSNHYTVLGVDRAASHGEIRRAYHDAARRWHPDRFAESTSADASEADAAIRRVNEAWNVLGDPELRRDYDRSLDAAARVEGRAGVSNDDGVIRIDPRLLDPDFAAARRHAQVDEISNRTSAILRVAPVLAVLGLLAAIFVFTAYARRDEFAVPPTTFPGPSLGEGIEGGVCVRVIGGPSLLPQQTCANSDGRVIGSRLVDGECPVGTTREVELINGAIACLAPVG